MNRPKKGKQPARRRSIVDCESEVAQLKERLRGRSFRIIAQNAATVVKQLSLVGIVFVVARFAYLSAQELAGKETNANFGLGFIGKLDFSIQALSAATIAAIIWALLERALKGNTIKQLSGEKERLEMLLDPNRTSSNLTKSGKTNPRDL